MNICSCSVRSEAWRMLLEGLDLSEHMHLWQLLKDLPVPRHGNERPRRGHPLLAWIRYPYIPRLSKGYPLPLDRLYTHIRQFPALERGHRDFHLSWPSPSDSQRQRDHDYPLSGATAQVPLYLLS